MGKVLATAAKQQEASIDQAKALACVRKHGPATIEVLAKRLRVAEPIALKALQRIQRDGVSLLSVCDGYWWMPTSPPGSCYAEQHAFISDRHNVFRFGAIGDTHLCSKYERLDVLESLYDKFAASGIKRVYHAGNWVDGEARFNRAELTIHGMDNQLAYLADKYPQRKGITTYAISGDDHEGWYGQREGIDIGRHCERVMHEHGRKDWIHIGHMESYVPLVNGNRLNGRRQVASHLLVMHPGGGSAYAYSYKPQKIVESFSGGEKPACLLVGHYHKMSMNEIRGVWAFQTGCTQDQSMFMRKKALDAHVGGWEIELEQDPQTGAIVSASGKCHRYFVKGYYNERWGYTNKVTAPRRER